MNPLINWLAAALIYVGFSAMAFEPPGPEQCRDAIGPTDGLPEILRRAFDPASDFKAIPKPGASDWLANHNESGQTFADFKASRPPMDLCPVDLRKLQFSVGFDLAKRYEKLMRFYEAVGFEEEAQWTRARLKRIEPGGGR